MAKKEVLILQHVPNESAGTILDYLKEKKIPHHAIHLYNGKALPKNSKSVRSIVVMGGPMNVYEEYRHSFLKSEDVFLKEAIHRKVPCLGICLGAQLIAKALGHKVYKARKPEIGWEDLQLSIEARKDPLFSAIDSVRFRVLQWHGDTFDLPKDSVLLASSQAVPHQAYRYRSHVYGFQFHIEANRMMIRDWFQKSPDLPKILETYEVYKYRLERITDYFYEKFFSLC